MSNHAQLIPHEDTRMIESLTTCVVTALSAITNVCKCADNLASTAEAHSAAYKADAMLALQAKREELDKA